MVEFLSRQRNLLSAVYPILLVLAVNPIVQVLVSVSPYRMDDVSWRFGATGMLIAAAPAVALALALMLVLAALLDHRSAARWMGIFAILFAVVIAVAVISFGLDALQVRRMIREDAKPRFDSESLKALLTVVLTFPVLVWAGLRAVGFAKGSGEKRDADGPPILVGS
ncbi:MAG TPA: hypothetical protein PLL69_00775 [Gemmatimonadales bacterium]|nr:hypothetical protein [Gemmatimonadales bacterium]